MELKKASLQNAFNNPVLCRPVKGNPNYIAVSKGMVYSLISNKFLRPGLTKATGYLSVVLYHGDHGPKTTCFVHRIIAESFIPTVDGKELVNHIDGIKTNNHVDNLEWCTPKENNAHATIHGLRKIKYSEDIINKVMSEHIRGHKLFGATALSRKYNIDKSFIHELLNKHKYN